MPELQIHQILALGDNYIYLLHDPRSGATAVVDPAEAEPVLAVLEETGWRLTHILITHHHHDHTDGNLPLKARTGAVVVGARADRERIPGIDIMLGGEDRLVFGDMTVEILEVPGHTSGHLAYWFKDAAALFCGDTLFALGCGRVFEGTPEQMWESLRKLRALPPETRVFCAHEYTAANARFAVTVDPSNAGLLDRKRRVDALRAEGKPTVPSVMAEEVATNPFLRADAPELQRAIGLEGHAPAEVFAEVRRRKNAF